MRSHPGTITSEDFRESKPKLPAVKNVVVVIPTHSRTDLLARTLSSLSDCDIPERVREIRVVENGPRLGASDVTTRFSDSLPVRYFHNSESNKSLALNHAIADLSEELVIFFDDDLRFSTGILQAYCNAAESHPKQRFFGGPFDCDYDVTPAERIAPYLPQSATGWRPTHSAPPENIKFFIGFNWAAYARDVRAVGLFDPRFGPGSTSGATGQEETLQARLIQSGCTPCYVPEALVWHYVPAERCSYRWTLRRSFRNGLQMGQRQAEKMRLKSPPRWMWRKLLEAYLEVGVAYFSTDDKRLVRARVALQSLRGTMQGIREHRRQRHVSVK